MRTSLAAAGRPSALAAAFLLALVSTLSGCCLLFGTDPEDIPIRAATAAIPDEGRRSPSIDLSRGLGHADKAALVEWMVWQKLTNRAGESEVHSATEAVKGEWGTVFDELAKGPVKREDLDYPGRLGRYFFKPNPVGIAFEGHDARFQALQGEDILVLARPTFAFAFYRVAPPDRTDASGSSGDYRWLVVLDGDVVLSVE